MQDRQSGTNVTVSTDGDAGPYLLIGRDQLDRVTQALNENGIIYSVDRDAIRADGVAVTSVVNLGQDADATAVQSILDEIEDGEDQHTPQGVTSLKATATRALVSAAIDLVPMAGFLSFPFSFDDLRPKKRAERQKNLEERKTQLVKELSDAGIDPVMFDVLLSNELDRQLKLHFGAIFLCLTVVFTIASYAIVILNATQHWQISEIAITALIIETPIQFIGLLYVIARNLFPNNGETPPEAGSTDDLPQ